MSNILAGIGPHSTKHPCIYCQGTVGLWEEDADSRTPHDIKYWHDKWMSSGGRKFQLKHFFNCAHIPLLENDQFDKSDMYLIFPLPALHLKLGFVNKIISIMIDSYSSLENCLTNELNISREDYYGNQFEGKYCILCWVMNAKSCVCMILNKFMTAVLELLYYKIITNIYLN